MRLHVSLPPQQRVSHPTNMYVLMGHVLCVSDVLFGCRSWMYLRPGSLCCLDMVLRLHCDARVKFRMLLRPLWLGLLHRCRRNPNYLCAVRSSLATCLRTTMGSRLWARYTFHVASCFLLVCSRLVGSQVGTGNARSRSSPDTVSGARTRRRVSSPSGDSRRLPALCQSGWSDRHRRCHSHSP
jgi:hypothetical protein